MFVETVSDHSRSHLRLAAIMTSYAEKAVEARFMLEFVENESASLARFVKHESSEFHGHPFAF